MPGAQRPHTKKHLDHLLAKHAAMHAQMDEHGRNAVAAIDRRRKMLEPMPPTRVGNKPKG